jgi:hypoxanthine phosphoribosyltransferase
VKGLVVAKDKLRVYLSAEKIESLNRELGQKITADYRKVLKEGEDVLVIITLKGAAWFGADLLRHVDVPVKVDFVRLASYGIGTKTSGTVRLVKDIESQPEGQHVLVLDEIVDSGRTLQFLLDRLGAARPASLRVGALLSKPSRREVEVPVDYLGMEVEDKFLVGYGLDWAERYRNLKDIFYVEQ